MEAGTGTKKGAAWATKARRYILERPAQKTLRPRYGDTYASPIKTVNKSNYTPEKYDTGKCLPFPTKSEYAAGAQNPLLA